MWGNLKACRRGVPRRQLATQTGSDRRNRNPSIQLLTFQGGSHLCTIVHLFRHAGIEESHQLLQTDSGIALPSSVQFGFWIGLGAGPDVIIKIIVCRGRWSVSVIIVKGAFLWSAGEEPITYVRIAKHLQDQSIVHGRQVLTHLVGRLKICKQLCGLFDSVWILVRVIDQLAV